MNWDGKKWNGKKENHFMLSFSSLIQFAHFFVFLYSRRTTAVDEGNQINRLISDFLHFFCIKSNRNSYMAKTLLAISVGFRILFPMQIRYKMCLESWIRMWSCEFTRNEKEWENGWGWTFELWHLPHFPPSSIHTLHSYWQLRSRLNAKCE